MKFDAVVLRTDGSWECIEDIVSCNIEEDIAEMRKEDGTLISLDNIATIIFQPK